MISLNLNGANGLLFVYVDRLTKAILVPLILQRESKGKTEALKQDSLGVYRPHCLWDYDQNDSKIHYIFTFISVKVIAIILKIRLDEQRNK